MPARRPVAPLLALVACAIAFALLVLAVATGASDPVDAAITRAVRDPGLAGLLAPLRQLTDLGSTLVITAVAIAVVVAGAAVGRRRLHVAAGLTIALIGLGNPLIKWIVARERPDLLDPIVAATGYSFPSGHAASAMVAYGVVALLVSSSSLPAAARWSVTLAATAIIVLVGLSRVWLGVHYPTDVAAGWVAGGVVVAAFAVVSRRAPTVRAA